jgi:hypothetical protein
VPKPIEDDPITAFIRASGDAPLPQFPDVPLEMEPVELPQFTDVPVVPFRPETRSAQRFSRRQRKRGRRADMK